MTPDTLDRIRRAALDREAHHLDRRRAAAEAERLAYDAARRRDELIGATVHARTMLQVADAVGRVRL